MINCATARFPLHIETYSNCPLPRHSLPVIMYNEVRIRQVANDSRTILSIVVPKMINSSRTEVRRIRFEFRNHSSCEVGTP